MSNIVKARIQICGKRPLLQHQFGPEALPLEKGEKTGVAGNDPEEWKRTCMIAKSGELYVRGEYVFSMLREAAKNTKKGKGSIQAAVAATLQVEESRVMLGRKMPRGSWPLEPAGVCSVTRDPEEPVYLDVCGVVNPSTKGRNVRYRLAVSAGWKATFTIVWDKTIVSRDQMRAVVNDAGTLVGLADGRKVGYGRFSVISFTEIDAEQTTAA